MFVKADMNDVKIISEEEAGKMNPKLAFILTTKSQQECYVTAFLSQEIEVDRPVFDDSTAILMDFDDQSHGMHFIYLLPFSPTRALVESNLFSTKVSMKNSISIL